jgi:hypothetical protein
MQMPFDPITLASATVQVLLGLWGAIVSLHEDWAKQHRAWVLSGFVVLSIVGVYITIMQSARSAKETAEANTKLATSLSSLATVTASVSAEQARNVKLQERLLVQGRQIGLLATEISGEVTGRGTYCYFRAQFSRGTGSPTTYPVGIFVKGKYPMRNVYALLFESVPGDQQKTYANFTNPRRINLDDTLVPGAHRVDGLRLGPGKHTIVVYTRSTRVKQDITIENTPSGPKQYSLVHVDGKKVETPN